MNPIVLFFAGGESLYPGAALLLFSVATSRLSRLLVICWLRRISHWVGLAFMVVASPPFPWGVDAFFGIVFLAWMVAANRPESKGGWGQFHTSTTVVFALLLLVLPSIEFLHRRFPTIRGEKSDHVVVVGDSISAGLGAGTSRWPDLLHELTGTAVTNLSKPGATTMDGPAMIARLVQEDHLVLIELGGNDLISGERSEDFERSLGEVLARLASPRRTIVMFELPLLPHMVRYGQVQRRLAKKYGVWLIPKRCLATVLSGKDATSDGLHLTEVGAHRMASLVNQILSPVLKVAPTPTAPATHP